MNPSSTYAMSAGWKLLLLDMGLVPERILRRAGLPLDLFSRGAVRLPAEQYHALWAALESCAGRDVPLRVARALSIEGFDPPLFAAVCCPDLNRAAMRIAEFKPLIGPLSLQVSVSAEGTVLTTAWPGLLQPPASLGHTELLFWVALTRLATRTRVSPTRVTAPQLPSDPEPFVEYLGTGIERGAAWSVSFSELDAARPFLTVNESMWDYFVPELRRRLADLELGATTTDRVRAALLEALPAGESSVEAMARKLAVSKRTLQRSLRAEGATFQGVLSATRESLARHHLLRSCLSAAEISFLLGYHDPNSFYRAFHAWTGTTPEALRASAAS